MNLRFVKMHGCGNDYVYLDGVREAAVRTLMERADWPALVQRMSDRHKGIGSDGVIVVCPPTTDAAATGAAVRMRMFNSDGSESEMCGNGVRCVAKFAHDRLGVKQTPMHVETGRGVLSIEYEVVGGKVVAATVDMGEPILQLERVPVDLAKLTPDAGGSRHIHRLEGFDGPWVMVSMGNPHTVLVSDFGDTDLVEQARVFGPRVERHAAFPNRTNVHFMRNVRRDRVEAVTWERGAGITQACGTGACAVLVASVLAGLMDRDATIKVLGGELRIRWDESTGRVFMTGEAVDVFEGEFAV